MLPTSTSCAKGHPPEPANRGIEAAAAYVVGGQNFRRRVVRPAVQMYADFDVVEAIQHRTNYVGDVLRSGEAYRVGEGDRLHDPGRRAS